MRVSAPSALELRPHNAVVARGLSSRTGQAAASPASCAGSSRRVQKKPGLAALLFAGLLALGAMAYGQGGSGPLGGFGGAGAVPFAGGGAANGQGFSWTCDLTGSFPITTLLAARSSRKSWTVCAIHGAILLRPFPTESSNLGGSNSITVPLGKCVGQSGLDVSVGPILCNGATGSTTVYVLETW